jgi:tRNA-modifying protein YgfZ
VTTDWTTFLSHQDAIEDRWGATHFRDQPMAPRDAGETWLCDLRYQGLLALTGPDAVKFLQGQITCDVRELGGQRSLLGAQCDLKGRVLTSFRVFQDGDEQLLLRLHRGLVEDTCAALGKYMVFSKAKLEDVSDQWSHIGLAGPEATELLRAHLGEPPEQPGHWCAIDGNRILRLDTERYECWLAPSVAQQLWLALSSRCLCGGGWSKRR